MVAFIGYTSLYAGLQNIYIYITPLLVTVGDSNGKYISKPSKLHDIKKW